MGMYLVAIIVIFILGIVAFFFPIMPLSYLLDFEFSNLGPIATGIWAIMIDIFIVTPLFIYFGVVKFIYAHKKPLQNNNA